MLNERYIIVLVTKQATRVLRFIVVCTDRALLDTRDLVLMSLTTLVSKMCVALCTKGLSITQWRSTPALSNKALILQVTHIVFSH